MRFKFVSSGQSLDDAPVHEQTLRGNSLKPLAPTNLRGVRDAQGNLLVEWTRRSRFASGMRPGTDIPLGEESEYYEIEIYSGSTVLRTIRVGLHEAHPVQWYNTNSFAPITPAADGTLLQSAVDVLAQLRSLESITGDFKLEVTVDHSVRLGSAQSDGNLLIYPLSMAWESGFEGWAGDTGGIGINVENDLAKYIELANGDRVMVELRGRTFYYYKNHSGVAQPLFTSTRDDVSFPLVLQAELSGTTFLSPYELTNITQPTLVRLNQPDYLYTSGQQVADFGSTQASVKVRIYQVSAIVGRGHYGEATI